MRILSYFIITFSFFVLLGCGGGAGVKASKYKPTLKYEGKTTKASLNAKNIQDYINLINPTYGINFDNLSGKKLNRHSKLVALKKETEVEYGDYSGKVETTIEEEGGNSYSLIQVYSNYSNQKGIVLNGIIAIDVTLDDYDEVIEETLSYQMFEISISGEKFIFDGNSYIKNDGRDSKITYNLIVKHLNSSKMVKYSNFQVKRAYTKTLSYNGRIYISEYGYVDLITNYPFEYDDYSNIKPGSTFYIKGKSKATVKYAYNNRLRVELDNETFTLLNGKKVKNEAPIITISLPKEIYTNSNINPLVKVVDPDLDKVTVEYKWYVNSSLVSNKKSISNTKFKRGDKLKLVVVAKDGNNEANTSKEQTVLNSLPTINFLLDKTKLKIGEKIVLDASSSFDIDGDKLSYKWEMKPKFETKVDNTNLEELTSPTAILKAKKINYSYFLKVEPYILTLTVTDEAGGSSTIKKEITIYPKDIVKESKILEADKSLEIQTVEFIDLNRDNNLELVALVTNSNSGENKINIYNIDNNRLNLLKEVKLNIDCYGEGILESRDFNRDGKKDLIAQCQFDNSNKLIVLYQNDNFEFTPKSYTLNSEEFEPLEIYNIIPTDINGDSKDDIVVVANYLSLDIKIVIFKQNENGELILERSLTINNDEISHNLKDSKVVDIDNNGKKDIFIYPHIFNQNSDGSFTLNLINSVASTNYWGWSSLVDINSDETKDLLLSANNKLYIYSQTSLNSFELLKEKPIDTTLYREKIYMQDVNSDQKIDLIYSGCDYNRFCIIENKENWDYGLQAYEKIEYGKFAQSIDLDNNGKKELLFYDSNKIQIIYFK